MQTDPKYEAWELVREALTIPQACIIAWRLGIRDCFVNHGGLRLTYDAIARRTGLPAGRIPALERDAMLAAAGLLRRRQDSQRTDPAPPT